MTGKVKIPTGFSMHSLERTDSTNTEAIRLAKDGAAHKTVVWAREQTAGRGRFDRRWLSGRGNLYCSFVLRFDPRERALETLSLVAALATATTVESYLSDRDRVRVKWVNDVLVDSQKISGSLNEGDFSQGWLVMGIGINVELRPDITNQDYEATCLKDFADKPVSVESVLSDLCSAIDTYLGLWMISGFDRRLYHEYQSRLWRLGEPVTVSFNADKSETTSGENRGITPDGHLRLGLKDGTEQVVYAGDVLGPLRV